MLSNLLMEPLSEIKSSSPPIQLRDLFNIAEWQDKIAWMPFREGVEIYHLYGDGITGPSTALIRYRKGAAVPRHLHTGYEHILVLAGAQRDQHGTATAGTLSVNLPGTEHGLISEAGCIVLAIYEKPVKFIG
jgi:anti-sigma factor ChrR (cupin superfamily)